MSHKPHLIFDLEGNGLLPTIARLWCGVTRDIITGEVRKFVFPEDLDEFLSYLSSATWLCAHNGIDFDFPALKKLHDWEPTKGTIIIDTLVMSRHLNPDRRPVEGVQGPHSVEAWGKRLGRWKPEHNDWTQYSPEMLHRCAEDTEIQYLIYCTLCQEANIKDNTKSIFLKSNYNSGINWHLSMELEHKSAWIFAEQARNGCYFETEKAIEYVDILTKIIDKTDSEILQNVPPKPKKKGVEIKEPFKKTGDLKKAVYDWYEEIADVVSGPFSRVEWYYMNIGSDVQLKEWLYTIGWEPDEWNYKKGEYNPDGSRIRTSPKITETSLEKLDSHLGRLITLRSKSSHRRSQIQGWVDTVREDHRIEAQANPQGTPTGRVRHRGVANIPKVSIYKNKKDKNDPRNGSIIWYPDNQEKFFGSEMRSLFSSGPDPDSWLVGRDAAGLEARCFAHYLNNPSYTDIILNSDIHEYNLEKAELETRDQAKTFWYALLYGAGDEKVGSIMLPNGTEAQKKAQGKSTIRAFFDSIDGMEKLIKNVKKASGRGYLVGIDGRKLWIRKKSAALNTLLQGAGAQIMTWARIWMWEEVYEQHLNRVGVLKVLDYHDEETWESPTSKTEHVRELLIQSVVEAGKFFKFNCPLDADARIGRNWSEIH